MLLQIAQRMVVPTRTSSLRLRHRAVISGGCLIQWIQKSCWIFTGHWGYRCFPTHFKPLSSYKFQEERNQISLKISLKTNIINLALDTPTAVSKPNDVCTKPRLKWRDFPVFNYSAPGGSLFKLISLCLWLLPIHTGQFLFFNMFGFTSAHDFPGNNKRVNPRFMALRRWHRAY